MNADGGRGLDDIWTRFLAGQRLGREERCLLAQALRVDDVLHRRLLHDLRLDGALRAAARSELRADAFLDRLRTDVIAVHAATRAGGSPYTPLGPSPFRGPRGVAVAVGLALAAGLILVLVRAWPDSPAGAPGPTGTVVASAEGAGGEPRGSSRGTAAVVRIDALEGDVRIHGRDGVMRAGVVGGEVAAEDWVVVAPGGRLRTEYRNGTAIELAGDTVVTGLGTRAGHGRIFVSRGRLRASVPPGAPVPVLEVMSAHAMITAEACFNLVVSVEHTRLEVKRRHARMVALGARQSLEVGAGQLALADWNGLAPGGPATARGARPW